MTKHLLLSLFGMQSALESKYFFCIFKADDAECVRICLYLSSMSLPASGNYCDGCTLEGIKWRLKKLDLPPHVYACLAIISGFHLDFAWLLSLYSFIVVLQSIRI
jgi:hypothetical protein